MQTVKIGNTTYITNRSDIFALHAKCTGKHKPMKSKGAEKRLYPPHGASMSTSEYVGAYEALNAKKGLTKWDWQPLKDTGTYTLPSGDDAAWEVTHESI
jgi:hypothetical protein